MYKQRFPLMDGEPAPAGGGAAAGAAGAAAAPAPSALAGGAPPADATPADPFAWLPEKLRVVKEGGTDVDVEASAKKLAEVYGHLEKRLGSGDVPPKSAADYKVTVPDTFKDLKMDDERTKAFAEAAHKAGFTQAQFDFAMNQYFEMAPQMMGEFKALSAEDATKALAAVWKEPEAMKANTVAAFKAVSEFTAANGGEDYAKALDAKFGNDPDFIRFAAYFGAGLKEDKAPNPNGGGPGTGGGNDFNAFIQANWKAYSDPKDPQHAAVTAKANELGKRQFGDTPVVM